MILVVKDVHRVTSAVETMMSNDRVVLPAGFKEEFISRATALAKAIETDRKKAKCADEPAPDEVLGTQSIQKYAELVGWLKTQHLCFSDIDQ